MNRVRREQLPAPSRGWNERDDRPRVLVESSDPAIAWVSEGVLDDAGYAVEVCRGPSASRCRCPLLDGRGCALVDGADAIVHLFGMSERERYPVLAGIRRRRPSVPACVEVPAPMRERYAAELDGCTVVDAPITAFELVDAVDDAIGRRDAGVQNRA